MMISYQDAGQRADLFVRLVAQLLESITPHSRAITDWDAVVEKQSDWTLNEAYHNMVPANASTGTWPLSPPDKQFAYIPTYVNDNANCAVNGNQGSDKCQAQIFSYLEQLEPGLRYLNDSKARKITTGKDVAPLIDGLLGKQASEGALEIWAVDSNLGPKGSSKHDWQTLWYCEFPFKWPLFKFCFLLIEKASIHFNRNSK